MKYPVHLTVILLSFIVISCSKQNDIITDPAKTDSLVTAQSAVLPKQFIITDNTIDPSFGTKVYSIKYDSTNYRIDFYLDDTTNSNPYDLLAATYSYNNNGYLLSYKEFNLGNVSTMNIINRAADNKINWIAFEDLDNEDKDTVYFSYQVTGGAQVITTLAKSYHSGNLVTVDTFSYHYDAAFRLMGVEKNAGSEVYDNEYNANNSLKKVNFLGTFGTNETNLFYTSGIANGKEDIVLKTFLGKDYYLQNIKDLYAFNSFINPQFYTISTTDPHHPTRMQDINTVGGQITTIERTWLYEVNDRLLLTKVISSLDGKQETVIKFKY